MKIRHFLYNAFIIEDGGIKLAIDPGVNMKLFGMKSLIQESEWDSFTHVIVTHGDPDHYAKADQIAEASDAPLICGQGLVKIADGQIYLVHPRKGGIKSWITYEKVMPLEVGEKIDVDGIQVEALRTEHGKIIIPFLGLRIKKIPGPKERTGMGSMGFKINIKGKSIVNLGDTLLRQEWEGLKPDVLILPIGGLGNNTWTMDVSDAIEAVRIIDPEMVIPCHYNVPFLFKKNAALSNEHDFKKRVEDLGVTCQLMYHADEIEI